MTTKVFVGRLNENTTEGALLKSFERYGEVSKVERKTDHAFVYFERSDDADEAIKALDRTELDGNTIVVETSKAKDFGARPRGGGKPLVQRFDLRVSIKNIDGRVGWTDLKDWARQAGEVTYSNVFRRGSEYVGVVEYKDEEGMDKALDVMEKYPLLGMRVKIAKEDPDDPSTKGVEHRPDRRGNSSRGGDHYSRRSPEPRHKYREEEYSSRRPYDDRDYPPPRGYDSYESRRYGRDPPSGYRSRSRSRSRERSLRGGYPPEPRGDPRRDAGYGYERGGRDDRYYGRGGYDSRGPR
eukprot:gene13321-17852_t